jgi:hypothetical protein
MSNTKDTQQMFRRRRLLQGAALTLMATAVPLSANAAAPRIIAEDHWAQKAAVKL